MIEALICDRWASGTPSDSEDTMNFAALFGIKSVNESLPGIQGKRSSESLHYLFFFPLPSSSFSTPDDMCK